MDLLYRSVQLNSDFLRLYKKESIRYCLIVKIECKVWQSKSSLKQVMEILRSKFRKPDRNRYQLIGYN